MAVGDEVTFRMAQPVSVPAGTLLRLSLTADAASPLHHYEPDRGVVFDKVGWYEVLLRVDWNPHGRSGTRFAHTKIPDNEPLHSEAINADVLSRISGGRQLLRGNTVFGLDHTTSIVLEVWHDAETPIEVSYAHLVVRELGTSASPS